MRNEQRTEFLRGTKSRGHACFQHREFRQRCESPVPLRRSRSDIQQQRPSTMFQRRTRLGYASCDLQRRLRQVRPRVTGDPRPG